MYPSRHRSTPPIWTKQRRMPTSCTCSINGEDDPPFGGTQVDIGHCANGTYANGTLVFLALPPPYFVYPIVAIAVGVNEVSSC